MLDLTRITVFCFAASYTVALVLEVLALMERRGGKLLATLAGGRRGVMLGFSVAGLFAHVAYLMMLPEKQSSSPADWCLIASAVLATAYVLLSFSGARWSAGVFLLPIVLALIGVAQSASDEPITPDRASDLWGMTHGWLLIAATASVSVGFVGGLMYLMQSWRLKHNLPPNSGIKLPSLEWLEGLSSRSLWASVWLTTGGVLSGVALAKLRHDAGQTPMLWTDPVVLTSICLLAWLLAAATLRRVYPTARRGRKVAYATVAAFGFLVFSVGSLVVPGSPHGSSSAERPPPVSTTP